MEFSGAFTIGRSEISRFSRRIQWAQKERANLLFSVVGLLAGNFVLRFFDPQPTMLPQIICSLIGGGFVFAMCYGMMVFSIAKSCNSDFAAGRRWAYGQTLTINPLGVTCTTEEGKESHADFDELLVEECKEAFYIFISKESAWILPKDQLQHPEEDAARIREIFTAMAEPKRVNLRRSRG